MSSYDTICETKAPPGCNGAGGLREPAHQPDPVRHISPNVAHELNNILTVVQGYSDCLLFKHREDAALQPHLKMISDASRRASAIIREAMPKM
jgi:hypothetical protein